MLRTHPTYDIIVLGTRNELLRPRQHNGTAEEVRLELGSGKEGSDVSCRARKWVAYQNLKHWQNAKPAPHTKSPEAARSERRIMQEKR